tara:strand:+ start:676 stop:2112 length:1437 start_codon:yes stop_codon:yes gene_type:complete
MNKFKLKPPYDIDPVSRHEVPFEMDNVQDESGLVAKANKNGTMIVNKNIPLNSKLRKEAESHEDHHLRDMMDGKLDYDDNSVYHKLNGKVEKVDREDFNESDKSLPWEKEAYAAGNRLEEKDMRPKPNKLSGPPSMMDETPLAFQKIGSRHRFGRKSDVNKVSANENFGPAMVKRFTPLAKKDPPISGLNEGDATPAGTSYAGSNVYFSPEQGKLVYSQMKKGSLAKQSDFSDFKGVVKGDVISDESLENSTSYKNKPADMSDADYNKGLKNTLSAVDKEYAESMKNYNYYDDLFTKGGDLPTINYGGGNITLKAGQDFKALKKKYGTTMGAMDNMEFVYDKPSTTGKGSIGSGTITLAKLLEEQKAAGAKAGMKGTSGAYSDLRKAIISENSKQNKRNYELNSKELSKAQQAYPDIFKGTNTQELRKKAAEDKLSKEYFGEGGVGGILSDVGGGQRYRLEQEYRKKLAELKTKKFDI